MFEGGQANLYSYVDNDPVNIIDPTGEVGIVGAVVGAVVELGFQAYGNYSQGCDVMDAGNYDWGDVGSSAAIGAVLPGLFSSGKKAFSAGKAIGNLSGQSARTANRAAKIQQRISKNQSKIAEAAGTAAGVQAGKSAIKSANGSGQCGCPR